MTLDTPLDKDKTGEQPDLSHAGTPERISKRMARSGLCSRREAAAFILAGKVKLDGEVVHDTGAKSTPDQVITVSGEALPETQSTRLWKFYKPRDVLTASKDPLGRKTIYTILSQAHGIEQPGAMMPIGRLDMNSEGLLLLTNDGAFKRQLELPSSGLKRRYKVRVFGQVLPKKLESLKGGITIEGVNYGPIEARLIEQRGANAWIQMALQEGKNREIRRICEHFGWSVNRLIRTSYGPISLGRMEKGMLEEVSKKTLAESFGIGKDIYDRKDKTGTAKARQRPIKPGYKQAKKTARAQTGAKSDKAERKDIRQPASTRDRTERGKPMAQKKPTSGRISSTPSKGRR